MHRLLTCLFLLTLLATDVAADFSSSQLELHPRYPGDGLFIIEVSGTWPSDCHPGEQKPVIESFDGQAVTVVFEIIVVHVTCNDFDTPYRVLVDMSETLRATPATGGALDVTVNFAGAVLTGSVDLACPEGQECAAEETGRPLAGLYEGAGLSKQGILLARQARSAGIFPLVYDESGRAKWLFGGNHFNGDAYFSRLRRAAEGDCFGCNPTGKMPVLTPAGHIAILFDSPGLMQVKVNDGLFTEYRSLVFGYGAFAVGLDGEVFIDVEGRWGISENRGTNPPLGDITGFIPGAFHIVFESYLPPVPDTQSPGQVGYLVTTLTGEVLGQLFCKGEEDPAGRSWCEFIDPTDAAEPLFLFYQEGPATLAMEYGRPAIDVGIPPGGRAVRLD